MSCTFASLLLCLDISGLYIDGSLSTLDSGVERYSRDTVMVLIERNRFVQLDDYRVRQSYSHEAANPYGRIAIGYEQEFFTPNLRLSAELYHESSLETGRDRGVNGARINLRWYPFGGAR